MSQRKTAAGASGMQANRNGSSPLDSKQKRSADEDINQPGPSSKYVHVQSAGVELYDGNHNHAGTFAAQDVRVAASSSGPSTPSVIMQARRVTSPRRSNNEARGVAEGARKRRAAGRNDQYIQVNEIDSTGTEMCEEVDEVEQKQTFEIFQNYFRLINGE